MAATKKSLLARELYKDLIQLIHMAVVRVIAAYSNPALETYTNVAVAVLSQATHIVSI